jgi:hypothetical protein
MTVSAVVDAAGRRRSPATLPGYHARLAGGKSISWHPRIGAFAVWGEIHAAWVAHGREAFGYPITDELPCADGLGRFSHFRAMQRTGTPQSSVAEEVAAALDATDKNMQIGGARPGRESDRARPRRRAAHLPQPGPRRRRHAAPAAGR